MPNVLDDQLHAYAESWQASHREAINCRELEELIRLAMFLYDWIRRREEQWAEAVREDRKAFSLDDARRLAHLYELWLKPAGEMRRLIRDMRKAGFDVQGPGPIGGPRSMRSCGWPSLPSVPRPPKRNWRPVAGVPWRM